MRVEMPSLIRLLEYLWIQLPCRRHGATVKSKDRSID